MKCVKCWLERAEEVEAEFIYHGFSVCPDHFAAWHKACLDERDQANSKIIKPE